MNIKQVASDAVEKVAADLKDAITDLSDSVDELQAYRFDTPTFPPSYPSNDPEVIRLAKKVAQIFVEEKAPFSLMDVALFVARNIVSIGGIIDTGSVSEA